MAPGAAGLPQPEYGHVPLLLAPDGRRLAKRDRDQELGALQSRWSARELVGQLALLAGLIPEYAPISPGELIPLFSWEKLPQADCTAPCCDPILYIFTKAIRKPCSNRAISCIIAPNRIPRLAHPPWERP